MCMDWPEVARAYDHVTNYSLSRNSNTLLAQRKQTLPKRRFSTNAVVFWLEQVQKNGQNIF